MKNNKPRPTKFPANYVGPQIRRFRAALGWSQSKLALELQLCGLNLGREVVAQIEGQTHCVSDRDLLYFANVFKVDFPELFFGPQAGHRAIAEALAKLQTAALLKCEIKL